MPQVAVDPSVCPVPDPAFPLFRVPAVQKVPHLVHAFTRRHLPNAPDEFDLKRSDAARRRAELARYLGFEPDRVAWLEPDESGPVKFISHKAVDAAGWKSRVRRSSGLVTDSFNILLASLCNDNAVVLIYDPRWYGVALVNINPGETSSKPIIEAVKLLAERCGANPADLVALIGPSVGPCCYTFPDPALADARRQSNLWDLARAGLLKAGLRRNLILNPRVCTACEDTEYFSRNVDGPDGGAGAVVIGVRDDGALRRQLELRAASAKDSPQAARAVSDESLLAEERRLNALLRCPYGQKKVYVRSLFTGQSARTSEPEVALRCAVMREMGEAVGGYNIVNREYIITVCCADYTACAAYQLLMKRQKR